MQKHHHLALATLLRPRFLDRESAGSTDAGDFANAIWARVEDLQGFLAESCDDATGELRPDAFDEASTQIAFDALDGARR